MNPLITDLLRMLINAGVSWVKIGTTLRAHDVDPEVYKRVIDDKRTFKDFVDEEKSS